MAESSQQNGQKSLERITSPEQLSDYFKVTSPGVWIILGTVIALLAGLFVWASVSSMETLADAEAVVSGGEAVIYLTDMDSELMQTGMKVRFDDDEFEISSVGRDELGRKVAYADVTAADGSYKSSVVIESVHPISFLLH